MKIVYERENNRTAAYDDDKLIGECSYREIDGIWEANHTYVDPQYRGQSIASKLLEKLVDEAKSQDKRIRPVCSYVVKEFENNSDYREIEY